MNIILQNLGKLRINHYITKAQPAITAGGRAYNLNYYQNTLDDYIRKTKGNFCLIIRGDDDDQNDFYAIPYEVIKNIFNPANLYNDPRTGGGACWKIYINTNNEIVNKENKFNIKQFYGNIEYLPELHQKMEKFSDSIIFAKIGWSINGWQGFDKIGSQNKDSFGYRFVKEYGFAHEWWNFYNYGDEYYYGHIQLKGTPSRFNNNGLVLFSSVNYQTKKYCFIGFYGSAEYGSFAPPIDLADTILDTEIREEYKKVITVRTLQWRGKKEFSTCFFKPIEFDIKDIGQTLWGQAPFMYVGEKDTISKESVKKLLNEVLKQHESLLTTSSESDRKSIEETIEKTKKIMSLYFSDVSISKKYWQIAPGQVAKYWELWKSRTIVSIGFSEFTNKLGLKILELSAEEIEKNFSEIYPDNKNPTIGINQLKNFLSGINVGDYVLANKGQSLILGWGEIKSGPKYDASLDYSLYRDIEWKQNSLNAPIPSDLKGRFGKTIIQLSKEEFERLISSIPAKIDIPFYSEINNVLENKKQIILYGPPGTGKTWIAKKFVETKKLPAIPDNCKFVTFHPAFSYEEFIEGLRPFNDEEGKIVFKVQEGIFKHLCRIAFNSLLVHADIEKVWSDNEDLPKLTEEECEIIRTLSSKVPFILVIDEINRGDISRIFGELITLLETDKRLCEENEISCELPYSKKCFGIPPNIFIIGTMNTADRSIALMDIALRRRFGFIEISPEEEILKTELLSSDITPEVRGIRELAINVFIAVNERIGENYDRDHQIGHSFLIKLRKVYEIQSSIEQFKYIWYYEILPLLQEYFYDSPDKIETVLNKKFIEIKGNTFRIKPEGDFIEAIKVVASITSEREK